MMYFLFAIFIFSLIMTGLMRRYALAHQIIDKPNARSAHCIPTPRGGGVAFVLACVLAAYLAPLSMASLGLLAAAVLIAGVGFLDDKGYLNVSWRLFAHALAALVVLFVLHGCPPLPILRWMMPAGWVLNGLAFFYIVWLINLYNFMDGIDGLAALEAVCVCSGAVLMYSISGCWSLAVMPLVLIAAVFGFLVWNWPPARIFMGDAGSGFLGCILAALSLQAAQVQANFFWSWLILLGVFIVDATYTLSSRAMRLERLHEPHSMHAYQHAARRVKSHMLVDSAIVAINILWLWPLAGLVGIWGYNGALWLIIAYLPLIGLAVVFNAGKFAQK
jgi:Fuc2NAc and GlcNAc transferase